MTGRTSQLYLGIDLGSTSAKAVLIRQTDGAATIEATAYCRHDARLDDALQTVVGKVTRDHLCDSVSVVFTGSAGMGLAERVQLPFVQEVHAACALVSLRHRDARALLDIGGEDSKLVFFDHQGRIDARMNAGCAGGTGAFLDQMAALLSVEPAELEILAQAGTEVHPIASRCGVFAKTDVQNLLSLGVGKPDVALSVFHAMATQVLGALVRGRPVEPPVVMTGGPLTFLPTLREVFGKKMHIESQALWLTERGALACAEGAALSARAVGATLPVGELLSRLRTSACPVELEGGLPPLFQNDQHRKQWMARRFIAVPRVSADSADGELYLGIDSGSTTTKLVVIDGQGRLVADDYQMNHGEPLVAARRGMEKLQRVLAGTTPRRIRAAAVTGYGEELLKAAFGIELGLVETEAHLRAARALASDVSFVLDIGGQDMKAMFVRDGRVDRVEVNEACSSGCGTFLQTFAEALSLSVEQLAEAACQARAPRGLGSRCTVFMNSMVKQALREGAGIEDIAAGLAYSVVRNCLQKVLKLRNSEPLGATVVVQGGTFLNPAVHRAFEVVTGKRAICSEAAGLAGAMGAALTAWDSVASLNGIGRQLESFVVPEIRKTRSVRCKGCENSCPITMLEFTGAGRHISGNRCEQHFHNGPKSVERGINHLASELELLFQQSRKPAGERQCPRIGIPLALGVYENLPFWTPLLVGLGCEVVLSGTTDAKMVEEAIDSFCSESVCLPAKIASAHIVRLCSMKVDRIFFPQVVHESSEPGATSTYNCPIVAGYPEVVASAVPPRKGYVLPVSTPPVSFQDTKALRRTAQRALVAAGIDVSSFDVAFAAALAEYLRFRQRRKEIGRLAIERARGEKRRLVLLACRPYHLDPYLNHRVPELLADLGYDVVSCQAIPLDEGQTAQVMVLSQWAYPNRVFQAAGWVAEQPNVQLVQLNSFGCGPDAVITDEASAMLEAKSKAFSLLRIDESTATGSIRLRLRTLGLSARAASDRGGHRRVSTPPFRLSDRHRTILTVPMDPTLFIAASALFRRLGYRVEVLPQPDQKTLEYGLRYVNNEICYPAILTIGSILQGLNSGAYPRSEVAVALSQTGGPCRASNYIPLLTRAMVGAGFEDVPVVGLLINAGETINEQPGFTYNRLQLLRLSLETIAVTDAISMMRRAISPRERHPGQAARLANQLAREWAERQSDGPKAALDFVDHACSEMARIPIVCGDVPRVGIVGEIYVKYTAFANHHLEEWFVAQGIEPVVPPLMSFFSQEPVNAKANHAAGLDGRWFVPWVAGALESGISWFLQALNHRLARFPYANVHFPIPRELAEKASRLLSLTHQYGEGWVLGGEVLDMVEHGITKVVCLQPFGCIANQVVARGIERRLRATCPDLELLFLDLDHNTSEANLYNRLRLLVSLPPRLAECAAP